MRLKVTPRDFRVRELLTFENDPAGQHYVHLLSKTKMDTMEALGVVAKLARVTRNDIAFAGLKDRQGETEQWISIRGRRVDYRGAGVQVSFKGRSKTPINSKQSTGNSFQIVVRDLDWPEAEKASVMTRQMKRDGFINYFDDQRFGSLRHGQGMPMHAVLVGNFEGALHRILARPSTRAVSGDVKLKQLLEKHWGDWDACLSIARGPLYQPVFQHLQRQPEDFKGALAKVSSRNKLIHAFTYQSYLWNQAVHKYLWQRLGKRNRLLIPSEIGAMCTFNKLDDEPREILQKLDSPLYAPDGEGGSPEFHTIMLDLLHHEELKPKEMRENQVPGMYWRQESRPILVVPENMRISQPDEDEEDRRFAKLTLTFALPRGAYATMLIKQLFAQAGIRRDDQARGSTGERYKKDHS